jgi:predicted lipid-binding transport protein (Tim44 family)
MIYIIVDIIIFAAIAFYIFFKLNKQLGKIDEEEKKIIETKIIHLKNKQFNDSKKKDTKKNDNVKIIGSKSSASTNIDNLFEEKHIEKLDTQSKENLKKIFTKTKINAEFFLNGAKVAFETILQSFAHDKLDDVKNIISDKIFNGFKLANEKRKEQGKSLTTNIISFDKVVIISVNITANQANIAVKFISQQINYITGAQNEIIIGSRDEIKRVEDIWTFKKDLKSDNPNWKLCATSHS